MRAMRSKLIWLLLDHVRAQGRDAGSLADRVGLSPAERQLADRADEVPAVPIDRVTALADAAATALGDPLLGLNVAEHLPRGVYGVLEFALRHAPTLGAAAARLVRYERIHNDAIVWRTALHDREASLGFTVPGLAGGLGRQLDELITMTVLRFMRELAGRELAPLEVRFAHRDRASLPAVTARLGTDRIVLGAGETALVFAASVWHLPVADADPALLAILDAHAEMLLPERGPAEATLEGRLREHLRRHLSGAPPTIDDAARALRTTRRVLQRSL
jgi:hypothetical protein